MRVKWASAMALLAAKCAADAQRPERPLEGAAGSGDSVPLREWTASVQAESHQRWTELVAEKTTSGKSGEAERNVRSRQTESFRNWHKRIAIGEGMGRNETVLNGDLFGKDDAFPFNAIQMLVHGDGFCTATLVGKDIVLTNRQCLGVQEDNELPLNFFGNTYLQFGHPSSASLNFKAYFSRVLWSDASKNYAFLQLDDSSVGEVLGYLGVFWTEGYSYRPDQYIDHFTSGVVTPNVVGTVALDFNYNCTITDPKPETFRVKYACHRNWRAVSGAPIVGPSGFACKPQQKCTNSNCLDCTIDSYPPYVYGIHNVEDIFTPSFGFRDDLYKILRDWTGKPTVVPTFQPTKRTTGEGSYGNQTGESENDNLEPSSSHRDTLLIIFYIGVAASLSMALVMLYFVSQGKHGPRCCSAKNAEEFVPLSDDLSENINPQNSQGSDRKESRSGAPSSLVAA